MLQPDAILKQEASAQTELVGFDLAYVEEFEGLSLSAPLMSPRRIVGLEHDSAELMQ